MLNIVGRVQHSLWPRWVAHEDWKTRKTVSKKHGLGAWQMSWGGSNQTKMQHDQLCRRARHCRCPRVDSRCLDRTCIEPEKSPWYQGTTEATISETGKIKPFTSISDCMTMQRIFIPLASSKISHTQLTFSGGQAQLLFSRLPDGQVDSSDPFLDRGWWWFIATFKT